MIRPDRPVQNAEEIEITPEMIEAGKSSLIRGLGLYLEETATDQRLERVVRGLFQVLSRGEQTLAAGGRPGNVQSGE